MKIDNLLVSLLFGGVLPLFGEAIGAGHEYENVKLSAEVKTTAAELPATLRVEPKTVIRRYDALMFGLSYDFAGLARLQMSEVVPNEPYPRPGADFLTVAKGIPLPLNRMDMRLDLWKKSIGPMEKREKIRWNVWSKQQASVTGPVEVIRSILAVDPKAAFDILLPVSDAAIPQIHEIAEFLLGDASTPWGRKRIEYGLAEPVKVAVWELGNETDWKKTGRLTADDYVRLCRLAIREIRKLDPHAKFAPHAATAPWHASQAAHWKEWHRKVLKELAPEIHYLAFHPYYHGYKVSEIERYIKVITDDIASSANPSIGLFISEHGLWPGGEPGPWKNSWYKTHALVGCLAVSEWFNRVMANPKIKIMTMHSASSGPWGMFYANPKTGKPYSTALADLFQLYAMIPFGGDVVAHSFTGAETAFDQKLSLSAVAVRGRDGLLRVMITNRQPETARRIRLDLGGRRVREVYTLTADSIKAMNSATARPVSLRRGTASSAGFLAPPKSISLLVAE